MWPVLLDMTKEESMQSLRKLELEAYAHLVDALRAQGPLNSDKKKLLKETGAVLNIPQDRHKAEVRRAVNDERLHTIAYHVTGLMESRDDWAQEGRRFVPLMPRMAPQTVYSAIADEAADNASQMNKELPLPACTERKRPPPMPPMPVQLPETSKALSFRIPEPPQRPDDNKKRKMPLCTENSSLAQHLLGPPKMSRTQQFYRQRTKALLKDHGARLKQHHQHQLQQQLQQHQQQQQQQQENPKNHPPIPKMPPLNGPKMNILQNIIIPPPIPSPAAAAPQQPLLPQIPTESAETIEQIQNEINNYVSQKPIEQNNHVAHSAPITITTTTTPLSLPGCSNENQIPLRPKLLTTNMKQPVITFKSQCNSPSEGPTTPQKTFKLCPTRRPPPTTMHHHHQHHQLLKSSPLNQQKVIVVSNAQTIATPTSSSILQKTLQIPLVKNLSIKNLDKFKIFTTSSVTGSLQLTTTPNTNSLKHKAVTVKTNHPSITSASTTPKKVIPLSQLLNSKGGIKVLPVGGKIVAKTTTTNASPLYITMGGNGNNSVQKTISSTPITAATTPRPPPTTITTTRGDVCDEIVRGTNCNNKSGVLGDILKASGVTADDFDAQIEEFRIPNNHFIADRMFEGDRDIAEFMGKSSDNKTDCFEIMENEKDTEEEIVEIFETETITDSETFLTTETVQPFILENYEDVSETN